MQEEEWVGWWKRMRFLWIFQNEVLTEHPRWRCSRGTWKCDLEVGVLQERWITAPNPETLETEYSGNSITVVFKFICSGAQLCGNT